MNYEVWTTKDKRKVRVVDMSDLHLKVSYLHWSTKDGTPVGG